MMMQDPRSLYSFLSVYHNECDLFVCLSEKSLLIFEMVSGCGGKQSKSESVW